MLDQVGEDRIAAEQVPDLLVGLVLGVVEAELPFLAAARSAALKAPARAPDAGLRGGAPNL
jgi:hypothetical protein